VLAIELSRQQHMRGNGIARRDGRQRHSELQSVSGGIARDRSTTTQRSRQGSKTTAGRERSRSEGADLDGENVVVAWVDTASSSPRSPHVIPAGIAGLTVLRMK